MLWLILALLICVALASVVVGLVAVPARREGRPLLTERGEHVVARVTDGTEAVASKAKGATESVKSVAKRDRADA
ncbi:hypothetical protein G9U51_01270 [Calidifontibacter sp. DB0510]|uniref:Uncharacterized protein n=1 Tax=Metallococcus carri TaxID=1656884 RepID=A0A967AXA2_9MICO|nr:hypothetical protein [Metallococcus carri]NHN54413.1 hypothetical protein [Metallococcus carri]NOP36748.1 hypothetical protein [Calidifontibacter sp. DB2511S]